MARRSASEHQRARHLPVRGHSNFITSSRITIENKIKARLKFQPCFSYCINTSTRLSAISQKNHIFSYRTYQEFFVFSSF